MSATFLLCKKYIQYNEYCRFANKIPLNPIGRGFEGETKNGNTDTARKGSATALANPAKSKVKI